MADNDSFSWVPGTVCSARYNRLAADCSEQLFEPWSGDPLSLVPKTLGREPSFSAQWPWATGVTPTVPPAITTQLKDMTRELSGPKWIGLFPADALIDDLSPNFRAGVQAFLKAVTDANGSYHIIETYRSPERAYLMHWAWEIAYGKITAQEVDENDPMSGVYIQWAHSNDQDSIHAARQMIAAYQLDPRSKFAPALQSSQTAREAVDMTINVNQMRSIKDKNGVSVQISKLADLYPVGKSYGVIKGSEDTLHWSADGY